MLGILRNLVQEVNSARDLQEALEIIVSRVQNAMETEVCSVYLLDPSSNRYILMATEGLYREAVGKVSLGHSEGLIGLVGSREEPINLEDATSHPHSSVCLKAYSQTMLQAVKKLLHPVWYITLRSPYVFCIYVCCCLTIVKFFAIQSTFFKMDTFDAHSKWLSKSGVCLIES